MFTNIHSHNPAVPGAWVIQNLSDNFEETKKTGNYSIGLHPWYINTENRMQALKALEQFSKSDSVLAIGECGLDKACDTDLILQQQVFTEQVHLANEIKKPLIIHCVRAFDELLSILKQSNNMVPVIFHGFNKNGMVAARIISNGYWLSFGKAIFGNKTAGVFAKIPTKNIFLETDDTTIKIEDIYKRAAQIKDISTEELSLQLEKNIHKVFNIDL